MKAFHLMKVHPNQLMMNHNGLTMEVIQNLKMILNGQTTKINQIPGMILNGHPMKTNQSVAMENALLCVRMEVTHHGPTRGNVLTETIQHVQMAVFLEYQMRCHLEIHRLH